MNKFMRTSIQAQNIVCGGCASTITTELSTIKSISNLQVDVESGKVSFDHLSDDDISTVKNKLKTLGYPAIDVQH